MALDPRIRDIGPVETTRLFDMVVDLAPPLHVGVGPLGRRIVFHAGGGSFEGPLLRGEVLASGGDWALVRADGSTAIDVRLTLRTHDGALISMTYGGRYTSPAELSTQLTDRRTRHTVDPKNYYFRSNPLFETGAAAYAWLNDVVCVGSGYFVEGGIAYRVAKVV
ncbi:MAG: hypothetical protein RLZZ450_1396 [Pseudomonadota bacterium]|jgi:hypothetical protein